MINMYMLCYQHKYLWKDDLVVSQFSQKILKKKFPVKVARISLMRKYVPLKPGKKWFNRENKLRLLQQRSCHILLKITTLRFVFKQLSTEREKEGKEHEKKPFFFFFFFLICSFIF